MALELRRRFARHVQGQLSYTLGKVIDEAEGMHDDMAKQAELTLGINNSTYQPLHEGTHATIRQASLSGPTASSVGTASRTPIFRNRNGRRPAISAIRCLTRRSDVSRC